MSQHRDIATFEITPNHLVFAAPECYTRLGTKVQMNPPIRDAQHRDALWRAVREGLNDVIGTDHAPHTLQEKNNLYPATPSGMPGVQTLVPLMLDFVHKGKLSMSRWIELGCENPARIFGIKNKGQIKLGFDADFTIVDLKKEFLITNDWIQSKVKWTPFAGQKVTGFPVHTIVHGNIVVQEGQLQIKAQGQAQRMNLC